MLRAGMAQQAAAAALAAMVAGNADCALEAGALGTQQLLAKLSAGVGASSDDAIEAAADALAACAAAMPPGVGFPAAAAAGAVAALRALPALAEEALREPPPTCCADLRASLSSLADDATSEAIVQGSVGLRSSSARPSADPVLGGAAAEGSADSSKCPFCGSSSGAAGRLVAAEAGLSAQLVAQGEAPPAPWRFLLGEFAAVGAAAEESGSEALGAVDAWAAALPAAAAPSAWRPRGWEVMAQRLHMRMTSHDDVGAVLWPAAAVLSRWLVAHPQVLSGRDVLEIGAGMGLTGIVAAGQARRAVLSDFNWAVLCNLRRNIALNGGELCFEPAVATAKEGAEDEGAGQVDASSGDAGVGDGATRSGAAASGGAEGSAGRSNALRDGLVDAQWLDWDALPGSESPRTASCPADFDDASSGRFDAVIATDMVISLSDCRGVARVCATCLRPGGFAVFAVAPPDVRFGTEHLGPALEAAGLAVTKQTVAPRFAVSGGGEAAAATGGGYEARIVMYCAVKPPAEA